LTWAADIKQSLLQIIEITIAETQQKKTTTAQCIYCKKLLDNGNRDTTSGNLKIILISKQKIVVFCVLEPSPMDNLNFELDVIRLDIEEGTVFVRSQIEL
jgi:hypothetical protein